MCLKEIGKKIKRHLLQHDYNMGLIGKKLFKNKIGVIDLEIEGKHIIVPAKTLSWVFEKSLDPDKFPWVGLFQLIMNCMAWIFFIIVTYFVFVMIQRVEYMISLYKILLGGG